MKGKRSNKVRDLQAALKTAIDKGDVGITRAADATKDAMQVSIRSFFAGFDDLRARNVDAIATTRSLVGAEAKWVGALSSLQRVEAFAEALDKAGNKAALDEFTVAVAQAQASGRLVVSENLRKTLGRFAMKGLRGVGAVGIIADIATSQAEAKEFAFKGDKAGAQNTMNGLMARLSYGWVGSEVGLAFGAPGGPWGMGAGAVVGGIGGIFIGEAWVQALEGVGEKLMGMLWPKEIKPEPLRLKAPQATRTLTARRR